MAKRYFNLFAKWVSSQPSAVEGFIVRRLFVRISRSARAIREAPLRV